MTTYLTNLITEKGKSTETEIRIEGHIGLTYQMLIEFIEEMTPYHEQIRKTLVKIDFYNGDVFHYLDHLAHGMIKSAGF